MSGALITPAAALVSGAAVLVLLALALLGARTGGGGVRSGLTLACTALALLVACGLFLLGREGVPYNVRELLESGNRALVLTLLGTALLLIGGIPMAGAIAWERAPARFARWSAPVAAGASALVVGLLLLAAPPESLDDLVGAPVLGIGGALERGLRLGGLLLAPLALLTVGARFTGGAAARAELTGLIALVTLAVAGWVVVVPLACTDNLTELLRGGGGPAAWPGVAGLLLLAGAAGGAFARVTALRRPWRSTAAAAVLPASTPVAWQLLVLATEPRIAKYGQTFAARQFLLSPGRDRYLDDPELFPRFAFAWVGLLLLLSLAMSVGSRLSRARSAS